jgi:predicted porin
LLVVASNLAWCAHSPGAFAQSSVTLAGVLDSGLAYTSNNGGHAVWSQTSGQLSPSRLIFAGQEDLGGGTRAIFDLIEPFYISNGRSNGRAFNVAFVGIANPRFGTVSFGRQWDTTIDTVAPFASNEQWAGYIGAHIGDADNTQASFKVSNAVKYSSPSLWGISVGATYAFSNQAISNDGASGFTDNRLISLGASYKRDAFSAGVGYLRADRPGSNPSGALGSPGPGVVNDYANTFTTSLAGNAGVERQSIALAGASWRLGALLVGGIYSRVQYRYLDDTQLTLANYEANLSWQITPMWLAGIAYIHTDGRYSGLGTGDAKPRWDQVNLGLHYALSKLTTVYLLGVVQQGHDANAQIYRAGSSDSRGQVVVTAGVAHKF